MSSEPTEDRHRHADPARPIDEPAGSPAEVGGSGAEGSSSVMPDGGPLGDVGPVAVSPPATPALSRRELRERERRRAAGGADRPGEAPSGGTAGVPIPGVWPAGPTPGVASAAEPQDEPVGPRPDAGSTAVVADRAAGRPGHGDVPTVEPTSRMAETVPSDTSRYRRVHYLVLALVACVLGYLIWSLTTGAAEPGASSAGPAVSITSPSALLTATQGEL